MEYKTIIYLEEDKDAKIVLNNPNSLNVFNETLINELLDALKKAEINSSIKTVTITATGKSFSGGGDINEMYEGIKEDISVFQKTVKPIGEISFFIKSMSKPVIIGVLGAVAGAAFNIALACDFCIAAENARFIQSFVKIGLIPDAGGIFMLTRALGVNKTTHITMLGDEFSAIQGKSLGFVYDICATEELDQAVHNLAKKLAAGPIVSYKCIKQLIWESEFKPFADYLNIEYEKQIECENTDDYKEGVSAFKEKRPALFEGWT